jgi:hypothetical protein
MTWRDKLEIGLKEDAPYRTENLPQARCGASEILSGLGDRLGSRWRASPVADAAHRSLDITHPRLMTALPVYEGARPRHVWAFAPLRGGSQSWR